MRYGRTLDWLDRDGHASCFWPDADVDYGFFKGPASAWVEVALETEAASARRWHVTTGVLVEVDGDDARAESYGFTVAAHRNADGELADAMFGGRYLDELQRRGDEWRISARKYVADWAHRFPDGLDALIASGFALDVLDITEPGHSSYRPEM